jgi:hypothetical protein
MDSANFQKLNPVYEKYNLSQEEIKIYNMALLFEGLAKKYKNYISLFKKETDPRESKYWNSFIKFKEMYEGRNIDFALFFKAQFTFNTDKYIPNFLIAKKSYERYRNFIKKYKEDKNNEENFVKSCCKEIFKTRKFINDYLSSVDLPLDNYEAFFFYKEDFSDEITVGIKFAIQRYINPLFLSISNSFYKLYSVCDQGIRDEMITIDEVKEKRMILLNNRDALDFAKKLYPNNEISFWPVEHFEIKKEVADGKEES